jgi:hypothetical protein
VYERSGARARVNNIVVFDVVVVVVVVSNWGGFRRGGETRRRGARSVVDVSDDVRNKHI